MSALTPLLGAKQTSAPRGLAQPLQTRAGSRGGFAVCMSRKNPERRSSTDVAPPNLPIAGRITIEVRKSEVEAPRHSDTFTFGGRTASVVNRPWLDDEEGLVWKMWAV